MLLSARSHVQGHQDCVWDVPMLLQGALMGVQGLGLLKLLVTTAKHGAQGQRVLYAACQHTHMYRGTGIASGM